MPERTGALLARYGRTAAGARLVATADCEIWRITLRSSVIKAPLRNSVVEAPAGAGDLALHIYPARYAHQATIDSEVTWLLALTERGLHTPAPLTDRQGLVVQAWPPEANDAHDVRHAAATPRMAVLLRWVGGRHLDKALRHVHLHRVGALCAQMHNVSEAWAAARRIASTRTR